MTLEKGEKKRPFAGVYVATTIAAANLSPECNYKAALVAGAWYAGMNRPAGMVQAGCITTASRLKLQG